MKYFLINKKLFILLLICLAGFWVLPKICLAEDFDNIDLKEIGKYLALPEDKVENLLHSLINIFYSEWTDLMASGYSTAEERAVPHYKKSCSSTGLKSSFNRCSDRSYLENHQ